MILTVIVGSANPIYSTDDAKVRIERKSSGDYCYMTTECDYIFSLSVAKDCDVGLSYFRGHRTFSITVSNNFYISVGVAPKTES